METTLFENMAIYEIILLLLGCLLFLISLVGIVIGMIRNQSLKKYLPLLFIAIVMIGFPSIKKLSLGNDFISIEKDSNAFMNDPSNQDLLTKLADNYKKINPDELKTPQDLTSYAKMAMLLGDNDVALKYVNIALEIDKNYGPAVDIKNQIESNLAIKQLTMEPENDTLRSSVTRHLQILENGQSRNTYQSLKIAEGHLLTGNTASAKVEADKVIAKNPNQKQAQQIIQLAGVEEKIKKAKESPENKSELRYAVQNFKEISSNTHQKAYNSAIIAKAYKVLGDQKTSEKYKDSVKFFLAKPVYKH